MPEPTSRPCPSCHQPMQALRLPARYEPEVELDLCFDCHGLWFDPQESLKLAPEGILALFKQLHAHRDGPRTPLAQRLACPECRSTLTQGFDLVRSGRYLTHRCDQRHGRFSSFSSFLIEKGFVRQLTRPEIADIARRVAIIACSACGAAVDLRHEDACSHCRSALSLLDPQAVDQALQRHGQTAPIRNVNGLGDAVVAIMKDRRRAEPETAQYPGGVDLFSASLSLISDFWPD